MELEFLKALKIYAGLVRFDLTDDICAFYLESLRPHGLAAASAAMARLARGAKVGRGLPTIDEVLELIAPQAVAKIDDGDNAAVVAGLIEQAMVRFGDRDAAKGFPQARAMIGELGWQVVGQRWSHLCETTKTADLPTLKAQWRQEIKGALTRAKAQLPQAPGLPGGMKAEAFLPHGAPQRMIEGGDALLELAPEIATEIKRGIDRMSMAAGERDESDDLW